MGAEKPTEMNERVEGEEQGVGKEPVKFKVQTHLKPSSYSRTFFIFQLNSPLFHISDLVLL